MTGPTIPDRPNGRRRTLLRHLLALPGLGLIAGPARAALLTPAQTEGPFYPTPSMRFSDIDNDLVKIAGLVREAGGQVIHLAGRVLSPGGTPVAGARVEIWQCDMNGRYMHDRDPNQATRDMAFQGFGHDITDAEGRYRFRTILPVPYPGRTPHIHVKVFTETRELTTQFYIADDPRNQRDGLFRRLSADEQRAVAMRLSSDDEPRAELDIVI